jgi:hypothetical protein
MEDFLQAFTEWYDAKHALTRAYSSCDSSPDYFSRREAEREETARIKLGVQLEKLIDDRIEAATGSRP